MNQERIFQILKSPHISEKSAVLGDSANQAVFRVATDAQKAEIKADYFNINVILNLFRNLIYEYKTGTYKSH